MRMLGIETSCDETSVAIVLDDGTVVTSLIASQIERHRPFGGVVPEIASREHLAHLMPLVTRALADAGLTLHDLDGIAVTAGPGLIGALLVGVAAAQGISFGSGIPLIPVNHLEGHIYSGYLRLESAATPVPERFLSLVVSGGHSSVYDVQRDGLVMINRTRDDAGGEVFDKVAKFIGFPYPGGPQIERAGSGGDGSRFDLPIPTFKDESLDFSFSGLKSTAIRLARQTGLADVAAGRDGEEVPAVLADFCASFQKAVGDQLLDRLTRIWDRLLEKDDEPPAELVFAGGVASNGELRERISAWCDRRGITIRLAERRYCTDNGAMIAFAGWQKWGSRDRFDSRRVRAVSRIAAGTETF